MSQRANDAPTVPRERPRVTPDNKPPTPAPPTVQEELRGRADDRLGHDPADQIRLERQNEQLRLTQAALEVSLERYRDLYENAPVGYVTTDADIVIVQANRMAARLMERPVEALIGHRLTQFMVPTDRLRCQQRHRALLGGQPAAPLELRLLPGPGRRAAAPDAGRFVRVELAMSLARGDGTEPQCRVTLVDIGERAVLRERLARLATIVTSSDDAIVSLDRFGRVTSWNAGAERLFGYAASEMLGGPPDRVVPDERLAEEQELLRRVQRGEKVAPVESERRRRDGQRVPVSLSIAAIRDDAERIVGCSLIARDIGERKRAEQALHKRMRQLDLLSQAGQALILGDAGEASAMPTELFDRVRLAIGCELCLSYELGEGDTLRLVAATGLSRAGRQAMATVPIDGPLCGLAARRRAPLIVEDLQAAPLPEAQRLRDEGVCCYAGFPLVAHGEVLGVAAFGSTTRSRFREGDLQVIQTVCDQASAMLERNRLIEALHARERSLRLADRRKDDFIATLAHELRNPLAPIRNAVDILRRRGLDDPQLEWCRSVIQRQVTQMTHLLEDLLDVSRVTRNKIELRRERVALERVIDEALETTQPLIRAQPHALRVDLPPEPVVVFGDPTRLTQVLANLLNNAAKYTDPGGRITLEARVDGDEVAIRVSDNGIGIDAAQLARVFEMFSQLEPALERSRGGLGLGLSLSRGLVELHGGRLEADSEGVGRGSTFTVTLPIVHAAPDPAVGHAPAREATSVRVLVVDDNADAAQTLATMLELQGMDSRAVYGGREGLEVAEQWRPEVVVVDIGMPDMNGHEFVRRLRAQPWGEALLAIACTGWGQNEDRARARAAGFDHHLVKPIEPEAIAKIVARLDEGRDVSV